MILIEFNISVENIIAFARVLLGLIVYTIVSTILIRRNLKEYRNTKQWNYARMYISMAVASNILFPFLRMCLILQIPWALELVSEDLTKVSLLTFAAGLPVICGLMFLAYINEWRIMQYFPIFYYISAVVFYFGTGIFSYLTLFNNIGGLTAVIGVYEASFRARDDNSLGLNVYYTFNVFSLIFASQVELTLIINLIGHCFGLYYATGKFTPFANWEARKERMDQRKEAQNALAHKESEIHQGSSILTENVSSLNAGTNVPQIFNTSIKSEPFLETQKHG